jgi:hypothetical protein
MTPEEKARQQIDRMLDAADWTIQDLRELNLSAGPGVAVREFPLQSGEADYLLFVDRKAVGVGEAKPEGTTLSGVAEQSEKYLAGVPANLPHAQEPLPFGYESRRRDFLPRFARSRSALAPRLCLPPSRNPPRMDRPITGGAQQGARPCALTTQTALVILVRGRIQIGDDETNKHCP